MQARKIADVHSLADLFLRHRYLFRIRRRPVQEIALIVETCGKEPKGVMQEVKASASFVNPAFAEDHGLHALAESFTYVGPFFESDGQLVF